MKYSPRRGRLRAFKRPIAVVQKKVTREYYQWAIDYKNVALLQKLMTNEGKIIPRRVTGMNAKQHRAIVNAIKNARMAGLLPFTHILRTFD
jgi:small subunit ribosomal protein S18